MTEPDTEPDNFPERIARVRRRIDAACARAERDPASVQLVAVSKRHAAERVHEAITAGLQVFGENRVQEASEKIPNCPPAEWHLIGHLQSNKARAAAGLFDTIHSVDSLRLLKTLDAEAARAERRFGVYLQVNVSGEEAKFGMAIADLDACLERKLEHLDLLGLMTMPPFDPDPETARPHFRALRELRDAAEQRHGISLPGLSMGMSLDFEVAIEEGATSIRVGSDLFGARP